MHLQSSTTRTKASELRNRSWKVRRMKCGGAHMRGACKSSRECWMIIYFRSLWGTTQLLGLSGMPLLTNGTFFSSRYASFWQTSNPVAGKDVAAYIMRLNDIPERSQSTLAVSRLQTKRGHFLRSCCIPSSCLIALLPLGSAKLAPRICGCKDEILTYV